MTPINIALVSETDEVELPELAVVASAIQKQVVRDFAPIWDVTATINAFPELDFVPAGHWKVIVQDDIDVPGMVGIHREENGQPFALVQFNNLWRLTASHEVLEMLADPSGGRLFTGNSVMPGQGRVQYLVEVCDPCEWIDFGYQVEGIRLCDFYTQDYFSATRISGVRYSHTGAIGEPRQVLKNGYLSWFDPSSQHWFKLIDRNGHQVFEDLGRLRPLNGDFRGAIDRQTEKPEKIKGLPVRNKFIKSDAPPISSKRSKTTPSVENLRALIDEIKKAYSQN